MSLLANCHHLLNRSPGQDKAIAEIISSQDLIGDLWGCNAHVHNLSKSSSSTRVRVGKKD